MQLITRHHHIVSESRYNGADMCPATQYELCSIVL